MSALLAIEMSTRHASLALWRDGAAQATRRWDQGVTRHQHLFHELTAFLRETETAPVAIAGFVVGVGPGSFAGIRVALAAANGLALPGGVPVRGLCSAAATARARTPDTGARDLGVIGDARRGRYWLARYRWADGALHTLQPPVLIAPDALASRVAADTLILSADGERIGTSLDAALTAIGRPPHTPAWPDAAALAHLAWESETRGSPLDPPQPLYLHPPVA